MSVGVWVLVLVLVAEYVSVDGMLHPPTHLYIHSFIHSFSFIRLPLYHHA